MNRLIKFLFGMSFTGILLLIFAAAIGKATFLENDYGTPAAKALVYNATWFEALLGIMVVNMIGVIITHKLYRPVKWPSFTFHSAFIIIIIGAAITRYLGFEGMMHIREGDSQNLIVSDNTYLTVKASHESEKDSLVLRKIFTPYVALNIDEKLTVGASTIRITDVDYLSDALQIVGTDQERGVPMVTLVKPGQNGMANFTVTEEMPGRIFNATISVNNPDTSDVINIYTSGDSLVFVSSSDVATFSMDTQAQDTLLAGKVHALKNRLLHTVDGENFVFKEYNPKGYYQFIANPNQDNENKGYDGLVLNFEIDGKNYQETILGGKGFVKAPTHLDIAGIHFDVSFGSRYIQLPFSIELVDFILDRYPGSNSPSSFKSEVVLIDEKNNIKEDHSIFMNNILNYQGYRFYQSSYDQDEQGTVLSVNHDFLGTIVTYVGYALLFFALIMVVFNRATHFTHLKKMVKEIREMRVSGKLKSLFIAGLTSLTLVANAQEPATDEPLNPQIVKAFSEILCQTKDGRIVPVNTFSSNVLRKVHKSDNYDGLSADEVFLGILSNPLKWQVEKFIKVKDEQIMTILGAEGDYAAYIDFFNDAGQYKLETLINEVYRKAPAKRNKFEKELITVDERLNIMYMMFRGSFLKFFPIPDDPYQTWISPLEGLNMFTPKDSAFVMMSFGKMFASISMNNVDSAMKYIQVVKDFQRENGAKIIPAQSKVDLELMYNKYNIFERIYKYYMLFGLALMILFFVETLSPKISVKWPGNLFTIGVGILFILHTIGLIVRWYISGHAPWSNGYESMIYIAWVTVLAGFIFSRKSIITTGVTALLSGIILFSAHLSWMDPEITNLVPVLRSYWLTIHVSCITASYGFFGLGFLMGITVLLLKIFTTKDHVDRINMTVKELTYVNELTLTIGLILLSIGNFLGGIWANESWGRYWGWDPKETWALATIIIYAFIIHIRFIPGLKNNYLFNVLSVFGFASVLMTYFGVNYYLSGLHSYAKGDPPPIPDFVIYSVIGIVALAMLAIINEIRFTKKEDPKFPEL